MSSAMAYNTRIEKKPLRVIVVGGSLSGLMCGIALKNAGHNVKIVEKDHDERQSHMSGICLGPSAIAFFAQHDASASQIFAHETDCLQVIKKGGSLASWSRAGASLAAGIHYITVYGPFSITIPAHRTMCLSRSRRRRVSQSTSAPHS
ncbi:hypothetical protein V2G26_012175 [Clonostachys chloroleuca]